MEKQFKFEDFVTLHEEQLLISMIPERYWHTLYEKVKDEIFDAGDVFMIQKVLLDSDDEESSSNQDEDKVETNQRNSQNNLEKCKWQVVVHAEDGISSEDKKQVYLIDHAWTYRVGHVKQQLTESPQLLKRMVSLMDINETEKSESQLIDEVFNEMWKFNQTYNIGNADFGSEASMPIWYIMDEFGSRIQHADHPSVRVVPFYFIPSQVSYSLLFLLHDLEYGDEATRNYVEGCGNDIERRKMCLLPWFPGDYTHLSYNQKEMTEECTMHCNKDETLPNLEVDFPSLPTDRKIGIFTDMSLIYDHFQRDDEQLVDDEDTADVLWIKKQPLDFKAYSQDKPGCILSQFPYERFLIMKDLMSIIVRISWSGAIDPDTLETTPSWLQTTYSLENELAEFVSYFQHREARGLDNVWICKPCNLGRGLDIHITDNLNYILRMPDTGRKIACKYISDPVLLELDDVGAVKFDIRYHVLLCSVKPLKVMVHHTFNSRVANKSFSLDSFDDVEKHLSVLAYKGFDIITVLPEDFIKKFEAQNPGFKFSNVQDHMFRCIKKMFIAVTSKDPPFGLGHSPQSRSMYGVDFMLKWVTDEKGEKQIQPVINECNFIPDFTRHQWFRKEFVNDIFHAMLLNDIKDRPVSVL